jgi:hypothetical protein
MSGINNHLKMEAIENFIHSVGQEKYTQFTKDFIEEWLWLNPEKQSLKDCLLALEYEIDSILGIINTTLEDYVFFCELKKIIIS